MLLNVSLLRAFYSSLILLSRASFSLNLAVTLCRDLFVVRDHQRIAFLQLVHSCLQGKIVCLGIVELEFQHINLFLEQLVLPTQARCGYMRFATVTIAVVEESMAF